MLNKRPLLFLIVVVFLSLWCTGKDEAKADESIQDWIHPVFWPETEVETFFKLNRKARDKRIAKLLKSAKTPARVAAAKLLVLDGQAGWALNVLKGIGAQPNAANDDATEHSNPDWLRGAALWQLGHFEEASQSFSAAAKTLLSHSHDVAAQRAAKDACVALAKVSGHKPSLELWKQLLGDKSRQFDVRVKAAIWLTRTDYFDAALSELPEFDPIAFRLKRKDGQVGWQSHAARLRGFLLERLGRHDLALVHCQTLLTAISQTAFTDSDERTTRQSEFMLDQFVTSALDSGRLADVRDWLRQLASRYPLQTGINDRVAFMDQVAGMDATLPHALSRQMEDALKGVADGTGNPVPKDSADSPSWGTSSSWHNTYDNGDQVDPPDRLANDSVDGVRRASWFEWHGQPTQAIVELQNQMIASSNNWNGYLSTEDAKKKSGKFEPHEEFEAIHKLLFGLMRREGLRRYDDDSSLSGYWLWVTLDDSINPTLANLIRADLFARQRDTRASIPWLLSAERAGASIATARLYMAFALSNWHKAALEYAEKRFLHRQSEARFQAWMRHAFHLHRDQQILSALAIVAKNTAYREKVFRALSFQKSPELMLAARKLAHRLIPDDSRLLAEYLETVWRLGEWKTSEQLAEKLVQMPARESILSKSAFALTWGTKLTPQHWLDRRVATIWAGPDREQVGLETSADLSVVLQQRLLAWAVLHSLDSRRIDNRGPVGDFSATATMQAHTFLADPKLKEWTSAWDEILQAVILRDDSRLAELLQEAAEKNNIGAVAWIANMTTADWRYGSPMHVPTFSSSARVLATRKFLKYALKSYRGNVGEKVFAALQSLARQLPDAEQEAVLQQIVATFNPTDEYEEEVETPAYVKVGSFTTLSALLSSPKRSGHGAIANPSTGSFLMAIQWLKQFPAAERGQKIRQLLAAQIQSREQVLRKSRGCAWRGITKKLYIHNKALVSIGVAEPPEDWFVECGGLVDGDLLVSLYLAACLQPDPLPKKHVELIGWLKQQRTGTKTLTGKSIYAVLEFRLRLLQNDVVKAREFLTATIGKLPPAKNWESFLSRSLFQFEQSMWRVSRDDQDDLPVEIATYPATRWIASSFESRLARTASGYDSLDTSTTHRTVTAWKRCLSLGFAPKDLESYYGRQILQDTLYEGFMSARCLKPNAYSPWTGYYGQSKLPIKLLREAMGMSDDQILKFNLSHMRRYPRAFTQQFAQNGAGYFRSQRDSNKVPGDWLDLLQANAEISLRCLNEAGYERAAYSGLSKMVKAITVELKRPGVSGGAKRLPSKFALQAIVAGCVKNSEPEIRQTLATALLRATDLQILSTINDWPVGAMDFPEIQDRLLRMFPLRQLAGPTRTAESLYLVPERSTGSYTRWIDVWLDRPSMLSRYGELIARLQVGENSSPQGVNSQRTAANQAVLAVLLLRTGKVADANTLVSDLANANFERFSPHGRTWLANRIAGDLRIDSSVAKLVKSIVGLPQFSKSEYWTKLSSQLAAREELRQAVAAAGADTDKPAAKIVLATVKSARPVPVQVASMKKAWDEINEYAEMYECTDATRSAISTNLKAARPDLALGIVHESLRHSRSIEHLDFMIGEIDEDLRPEAQVCRVTKFMDPDVVAKQVADHLVDGDWKQLPGIFPLIGEGRGLGISLPLRYFTDEEKQTQFAIELHKHLQNKLVAETQPARRAFVLAVMAWRSFGRNDLDFSLDDALKGFPASDSDDWKQPEFSASGFVLLHRIHEELKLQNELSDSTERAIRVLIESTRRLGSAYFEVAFGELARFEAKNPELSQLLREIRDADGPSASPETVDPLDSETPLLVSTGSVAHSAKGPRPRQNLWADLTSIPASEPIEAAKILRSFLFRTYRSVNSVSKYEEFRERLKLHAPHHDFDHLVVIGLTTLERTDPIVLAAESQHEQHWVMTRPWSDDFETMKGGFCLLDHALRNHVKVVGNDVLNDVEAAAEKSRPWKRLCVRIMCNRIRNNISACLQDIDALKDNWLGPLEEIDAGDAIKTVNYFGEDPQLRKNCFDLLVAVSGDLANGPLRNWSSMLRYLKLRQCAPAERDRFEKELCGTERSYARGVSCGFNLSGNIIAKAARLSAERNEWNRCGRIMRRAIPLVRVRSAWNMMDYFDQRTANDPQARFDFYSGLALGDSNFTHFGDRFYSYTWDPRDPSPDGSCAPKPEPVDVHRDVEKAFSGLSQWLKAAKQIGQLKSLRSELENQLQVVSQLPESKETSASQIASAERWLQRIIWLTSLVERDQPLKQIGTIPEWKSLSSRLDYSTILVLADLPVTADATTAWLQSRMNNDSFVKSLNAVGAARLDRCLQWFGGEAIKQDDPPEWLAGWNFSTGQKLPVASSLGARLAFGQNRLIRRVGPMGECWQKTVTEKQWTLQLQADDETSLRRIRVQWGELQFALSNAYRDEYSPDYCKRYSSGIQPEQLVGPSAIIIRKGKSVRCRTQLKNSPTALRIIRNENRIRVECGKSVVASLLLSEEQLKQLHANPIAVTFHTTKPTSWRTIRLTRKAPKLSDEFSDALALDANVFVLPVDHPGLRLP